MFVKSRYKNFYVDAKCKDQIASRLRTKKGLTEFSSISFAKTCSQKYGGFAVRAYFDLTSGEISSYRIF